MAKNLQEYVVDNIMKHNYSRLIEELKRDARLFKGEQCSYCNFPTSNPVCLKCKKCWCQRDYFCSKPQSQNGIMFRDNGIYICEGCSPLNNYCVACILKCSTEECEFIGCDRCGNIAGCRLCKTLVCWDHAKSDGLYRYCFSCVSSEKIKHLF
jgi:hypothetical protein